MISLANKNIRASYRASRQQGVTLLLSILLLAAITTIAFSLAVVGFAEISTSDDLARTEPVLYYSLGVAEEATYGMKRGEATLKASLGSECASSFVAYHIQTPDLMSTQTKVCNISPSSGGIGVTEITVPVNTYSSAPRVYVYDPATNSTDISGYTSIVFKKTSNNLGVVRVYLCPLSANCGDPTSPSNQTAGWLNPSGTLLDYNTPSSAITDGKPYEIVFVNSGSAKEYVEITTAPKGLPYLNKESVEIQSAYGRLIRRIRVLVPTS